MKPALVTITDLKSIIAMFEEESPGSIELLEGNPETFTKHVRLLENLQEIDDVAPESLVVLDSGLSAQMDGYLLDVAVRRALSRGAAAIALISDSPGQISTTARMLCRKSGLGLLRLRRANDVSKILHGVALTLVDELHLTINRVQRACEAIEQADTTDAEGLAHTISKLLGWQVDVGSAPDSDDEGISSVPVIYGEPSGQHFLVPNPHGADAHTLLQLVLSRMSLHFTAGELMERNQLLSASEVLRQLISGDSESRDELAPLAQRLGIRIDEWHAVIRFQFTTEKGLESRLPFEHRERLARIGLASARSLGGTWHVAQDPRALYLVQSAQRPSSGTMGTRLQRSAASILESLHRPIPDLRVHVGIGSMRQGLTGLASSGTEAHLAATHARSTRRINTPISFDAVGIRTTVVEWYGSPTVQRSIDALFEPLRDLSQNRRLGTVEILGTYLDCGGSISRTAEAMHLHRNAVRARLNRAVELLDVDLEDPDQRLFVHLACRSESIKLIPQS